MPMSILEVSMLQHLEAVAAAIAQLSFSGHYMVSCDVSGHPGTLVEAMFIRWDNKQKLSRLSLTVHGPYANLLENRTVNLYLQGCLVAQCRFILGYVSSDPQDMPVAHASFILQASEKDGWRIAVGDGQNVYMNPHLSIRLEADCSADAERSA
jgi:hypothetical protein